MPVTEIQHYAHTPTDVHNIEYLEDREVLDRLPGGFRWLKRNMREDVVAYFETMADCLEEKRMTQHRLLRHAEMSEA